MKDQFDWFVGEEDEEDVVPLRYSSSRWAVRSLWFLIVTAVITGALLGSWQAGQNRLEMTEKEARTAVQAVLDLEHNAFGAGDGDLYFSLYGNESDWIPAHLLPANMRAARAGFQVTRAEPHEDFIWANLSWTINQQTYQRIAFFRRQNEALVHTATAPGYWGSWISTQQAWGDLIYTKIDESWADEVSDFVAETTAEICWRTCLDGRLPFTLHLANDYKDTAVPGQLRIPSPRLLALDEKGQPADIFWEMLRQRLEAHLLPATIRFALPPLGFHGYQTIMNFDQAASRFMADNPDIIIELVKLEQLPDDPAELATEFDGAALNPTAAMLAAGLVYDITDYVMTDPNFDSIDFYGQIWPAAGWRGRTWFMPLAANMRVLYYDKVAYQGSELKEPSLRWTWQEMTQDLATLVSAQPETSDLTWGYLDTGLDSLYSYAYNWNNTCTETPMIHCLSPLQLQNVAAALDWYSQMAGQPGQMPDLTGQLEDFLGPASTSFIVEQLSLAQRQQFVLWNIQTSRRQAAIWVDLPVEYERQLLLANLGVVPFPGSDRFDGITPLWVQGGFISQGSDRPLAVWKWLKFLSYQRPASRLIPARPSVATNMGFWTYLPRPLGDAMRTAFPFARPVLIEEQGYLTWEQVTAVVSGELSPQQAAQIRPAIRWFNQDS